MQVEEHIAYLTQKRQNVFDQVKKNIKQAQRKQKEVYDRKQNMQRCWKRFLFYSKC